VQPPVPERALERERLPVKTCSDARLQSRALGHLEASKGLDRLSREWVRTDGTREKSIRGRVHLFFQPAPCRTGAVGRVSLFFLGHRPAVLYHFLSSVAYTLCSATHRECNAPHKKLCGAGPAERGATKQLNKNTVLPTRSRGAG